MSVTVIWNIGRPSRYVTKNQYDAVGRRSTLTIVGQAQRIVYGFDNANLLTRMTQGSVVVGWSCGAVNRFTGIALRKGITSTITPDAASEISATSYK